MDMDLLRHGAVDVPFGWVRGPVYAGLAPAVLCLGKRSAAGEGRPGVPGAAGALASRDYAKARSATIRRDLIAVAGRTAPHGRGHITVHLPEGWHREHQWLNLHAAACSRTVSTRPPERSLRARNHAPIQPQKAQGANNNGTKDLPVDRG
jgi:hypothetical protein